MLFKTGLGANSFIKLDLQKAVLVHPTPEALSKRATGTSALLAHLSPIPAISIAISISVSLAMSGGRKPAQSLSDWEWLTLYSSV